ncbi:MAG: hypothetical protein KH848_05815, partial [[Clostridium] spiroforme]|nr:hypothetical protein [Thomasclavelia spiroformis]
KENTDKALKYGIYRHLPTYEKIIRNLVSFSIKNINNNVVEIVIQNEINELIACLNNYQIINLDVVNQSLEEIFMHFYGGEIDNV